MDHNFSIKDPRGVTMESVDVPGKKTIRVKISLLEPGTYEFFCDMPFHPTLGMRGHFEVLPSP